MELRDSEAGRGENRRGRWKLAVDLLENGLLPIDRQATGQAQTFAGVFIHAHQRRP
jgi:hypothetical protein